MKKQKQTKSLLDISTKIIIIIIIFFMVSIFARFGARYLIIQGNTNYITNLIFMDNKSLQSYNKEKGITFSNSINWETEYPLMEKDVQLINRSTNYQISSLTKIKRVISNYSKPNLFMYNYFLNIFSKYEVLFNWKLSIPNEYNSIIYLKNNYLFSPVDKVNMNSSINSFLEFNNFLESKKIPFLYIQSPSKIDSNTLTNKNIKVEGNLDFSNQNCNELLQGFDQNNIKYLDLRKEIINENLDLDSFFFKTDHHWTPEAALWATKVIANKLNIDYNIDLDLSIWDKKNYTNKIWLNSYLGGFGEKLRLKNSKFDDFVLPIPLKKSNYKLTIPDHNIYDAIGNFDILINQDSLVPSFDSGNLYCALGYGDLALIKITNLNIDNNYKILLVGDSFNYPIRLYLSLGVKELDQIDLRYFTGSLKQYIDDNNYDIVIINFYPKVFSNSNNLNSNTCHLYFK